MSMYSSAEVSSPESSSVGCTYSEAAVVNGERLRLRLPGLRCAVVWGKGWGWGDRSAWVWWSMTVDVSADMSS
jgi:hypothetical protein